MVETFRLYKPFVNVFEVMYEKQTPTEKLITDNFYTPSSYSKSPKYVERIDDVLYNLYDFRTDSERLSRKDEIVVSIETEKGDLLIDVFSKWLNRCIRPANISNMIEYKYLKYPKYWSRLFKTFEYYYTGTHFQIYYDTLSSYIVKTIRPGYEKMIQEQISALVHFNLISDVVAVDEFTFLQKYYDPTLVDLEKRVNTLNKFREQNISFYNLFESNFGYRGELIDFTTCCYFTKKLASIELKVNNIDDEHLWALCNYIRDYDFSDKAETDTIEVNDLLLDYCFNKYYPKGGEIIK